MNRVPFWTVVLAVLVFLAGVGVLFYLYYRAEMQRELALAIGNFKSGNYRTAYLRLVDFINKYPDHPKKAMAMYWKARSLEEMKNYDEAIGAYNELIFNFPNTKWAYRARFRIALCLEKKGDYEGALANLREFLISPEALDKIGDVYLHMGKIKLKTGTPQDALRYFKIAETKPMSNPGELAFYEAMAYLAMDKPLKAVEKLETGQGREAKLVEEVYKKALELYYKREYKEAAYIFEKLSKFDSNRYSENALYWLGEIYYDQGNFSQALDCFNRVRTNQFKHKDSDALYKSGLCRIKLKDYVGALRVFERYLDEYPHGANVKAAKTWAEHCRKVLSAEYN